MNEVLTVKEAAAFLKKHPDTIRRWIETNKLQARKLSSGKNGIFAILRNDLLEFAVAVTLAKKPKPPKPSKSVINGSSQVQLPI